MSAANRTIATIASLVACSHCLAESHETNWLSVVRLFQAYAETPMPTSDAEKIATHDRGDERVNGHFNPVTNTSYSAPIVQVPPLARSGSDYLLLNVPVSPTSYDAKRGEMKLGLAAGNELVLGKALHGFIPDKGPCYLTIHLLLDSNDLLTVPISAESYRSLAMSGRGRATVAALVVGGDLDRRSVSASYYENQNEFSELPDTKAGTFFVYRLKVRPTSLQIATDAGTLTYSSDQLADGANGPVVPTDPRLAWIEQLKMPLRGALRPKKTPSLLEARQLGELLLDAAKAADSGTALKALEEGAYPKIADQVNGGNALSWMIDVMEQKKIASDDQATVVETMLRFGVDANGTPGQFPLGLTQNLKIAILLIRAGADTNRRYPSGETILMRTAKRGNADVVRVLLAAGADPAVSIPHPKAGSPRAVWSAEDYADDAGSKDVVKLLRSFARDGKAALALPSAISGATEPATATANFTPKGQTAPKIPGFAAPNTP